MLGPPQLPTHPPTPQHLYMIHIQSFSFLILTKEGCWEVEQLGFLFWYGLVFFFLLEESTSVRFELRVLFNLLITSAPGSLKNNTLKIKCQLLY